MPSFCHTATSGRGHEKTTEQGNFHHFILWLWTLYMPWGKSTLQPEMKKKWKNTWASSLHWISLAPWLVSYLSCPERLILTLKESLREKIKLRFWLLGSHFFAFSCTEQPVLKAEVTKLDEVICRRGIKSKPYRAAFSLWVLSLVS